MTNARRRLGKWRASVLRELTAAVLSLAVLAPLAIMAFGSFKSSQAAALLDLRWPAEWHGENYAIVFERGGVGRAFLNGMLITVSSMAVTVIGAAMASFYLDRKKTRGNRFVLQLFQLGLIAPMAMIPSIQLLQWLQLNGTFLGTIFIFIAVNLPFSVFLFTGFLKSVPREMDEAGIIDGCKPLRLFFSIVYPLLIPIVVTDAVIVFMGVWNDMTIPLFFLNSSDKWTMPLTVYNFFGQYSRDWNLVFADLILTALPVFLFYLFAQRFIIDGMTTGAVKG